MEKNSFVDAPGVNIDDHHDLNGFLALLRNDSRCGPLFVISNVTLGKNTVHGSTKLTTNGVVS